MRGVEWDNLVARQARLVQRNPEFGKVHPKIWAAVVRREPRMLATDEFWFRLRPDNFGNLLRLLLSFEKTYCNILMRMFDQNRALVKLDPESKGNKVLFEYELANLSRGQPRLVPGDFIILDHEQFRKSEVFVIEKIIGDLIKFSSLNKEDPQISEDITYKMSFHSRDVPFKRCTQNLREVEGLERIQLMLFEGNKYRSALDGNLEPGPLTCVRQTRNQYVDGRLNGYCNELQRQAIVNIIEAKCRPSLYILFGPPGTGKTATLIEAAGQIYQRNPRANILLCAPSNNCVNDLARKLLSIKCFRNKHVARLCSMNYYRSLQEKGAPIPRIFTDSYYLEAKRVIVTTNMMTPKIRRKFDYVLMDEAGHATIPESLLPCSKVKDDGCFVLAGDPKQRGPVIRCPELHKTSLGVSLLKRMFGEYLYGLHHGGYDPRYITKLILSYRSDPRLMVVNNEAFYRNELQFRGKTPVSLLRMLNFDRPLVFMRVPGKAESTTENYSPSWRNDLEADRCVDFVFKLYMMGLEPDQIGVIAYYSLQKFTLIEKFEQKLRHQRHELNDRFRRPKPHGATAIQRPNFTEQAFALAGDKLTDFVQDEPEGFDWHCKIDTVDAFQGNERDVIVLSTTLDRPNGFLIEPTRFNVATSRARWLTVIVGHPNILDSSKLWRKIAKEAYLA